MKSLSNYIFENTKNGFDTSWFLSKECCNLYNKTKENAPEKAYELYLIIDNTRELNKRVHTLMKSAVKHSDFDPEYCATCSTMERIIRDGVKEYNKTRELTEERLYRMDADFRKTVGLLLVTNWEA